MNDKVHSGGATVTCEKAMLPQMPVKYDRYLQGYYFLIDRGNCCHWRYNHLYGYAFIGDRLYVNTELPCEIEQIPMDSIGNYVHVRAENGRITIRQDWVGSFGLYIYSGEDGYFAISNSFMYLMEYLKKKRHLTLNKAYAEYFFAEDLVSASVEETLVNEIKILPNDICVEISDEKNDWRIDYNQAYSMREFFRIPLDCKEGLAILDRWHERWSGLYKTLVNTGQRLVMDVSGGFDTRIGLAVLLSSQVDLSKVCFNSVHDEQYTHKEDYEIASQMARTYGFKLNKRPWDDVLLELPTETLLKNSFFLKLGFHKQIYAEPGYWRESIFHSGGQSGETLRGYWSMSMHDFIEMKCYGMNYSTMDCIGAAQKIYMGSYRICQERFGHLPNFTDKAASYLYLLTRSKHHYAKGNLEQLFGNMYSLSPALDFNLHKLKYEDKDSPDGNLLVALIYTRYDPQLHKFRIEGNRSIHHDTLAKAMRLNRTYKFNTKPDVVNNFTITNGNEPDVQGMIPVLSRNGREPILEQVRKLLMDSVHKDSIVTVFGFEPYEEAVQGMNRGGFYPEQQAMSVLAAAEAILAVQNKDQGDLSSRENCTKKNRYAEVSFWQAFKQAREIDRQLQEFIFNFRSARLDIKNHGQENSITITNKDVVHPFWVETPKWFSDKSGKGCVVQARQDQCSLRVRCHGTGSLSIECKALDRRGTKGVRLPLWVTYTSLKINGQEQLDAPSNASHDHPLYFRCQVKDEELLQIDARWHVYNYEKKELRRLMLELLNG